jgi:hypothetical protein
MLVQRHVHIHVAAPCIAETSEEEASLQSMQGKPAADDTALSQPGRLYKYRRWLGHWKPEYDHIRTETELALHVSTSSLTCSPHDQHMITTEPSCVKMEAQCTWHTALPLTNPDVQLAYVMHVATLLTCHMAWKHSCSLCSWRQV